MVKQPNIQVNYALPNLLCIAQYQIGDLLLLSINIDILIDAEPNFEFIMPLSHQRYKNKLRGFYALKNM